jgi:hypothetical protein
VSSNRESYLLDEEVTRQGGIFRRWRAGRGKYLPLLLLILLVSKELRFGGGFLPPPNALLAIRAVLLSHRICFYACRLSLSARLASRLAASSGKVTPPQITVHTSKILHKQAYALKKAEINTIRWK